jgi:hypothetical protein
MSTTNGLPIERTRVLRVTGWKGHDWDTTDKLPYHSVLCLQSMIRVWRSVQKTEDVKTLGMAVIESVAISAGNKEKEDLKKKKHQRMFYGRVLDFMAADSNAGNVKYDLAYDFLSKNGWLEGKLQGTLRKDWDKWKLSTIHIVRGNSDWMYNEKTRNLCAKLNLLVTAISDETTNFLEKLFGEVMESVSKKSKWKRVAVDRKLLYVSFENCFNIKSAVDGYYTTHGGGGRLPQTIQAMKEEPNGEYDARMMACDTEIKKALVNMCPGECNDMAFQTSLISSDVHKPQRAHIDYDTAKGYDRKYLVAFLPLTETGQYLQFWKNSDKGNEVVRGEIVFIPKGQLVLVPGHTIHGGGFRADIRHDNKHAHMRLHFYVYPDEKTNKIQEHKNEYMDENVYLQNEQLLDDGMLRQQFFGK